MSDVKPEPNPTETKDSDGNLIDLSLMNTVWQHSGNKKYYQIVGYSWNGTHDTWDYHFRRVGEGVTPYNRSVKDFTGMRGDVPRFCRV